MNEQPKFKGRKNTTSTTAERAARIICKQPVDLSGRSSIAGYAIDSSEPDTPMDRDDAIAIEYKNDPVHGHVTVLHITIADVAASIPRGAHKETNAALAALDQDAQTNGETMYFAFGISPMLPEVLQNRLSLENGKERPGLTISVTLDHDANIVHSEFSRTMIRTHCKSYQGASKDIAVHGHPLQQISVVAKHVLKKKSSITDLPRYDPATGMYTDAEGNTRHINIDELSAYNTVQGCMIAANEGAAGLMRDSNFLFRNHSYTPRDMSGTAFFSKDKLEESGGDTRKPIQNKAHYSPECHGHYGLNAPMYSHVTSPIRRYADLANQRSMHWAIDVVEATTDQIVKSRRHFPENWDRERIMHHVWEHATQLLGDITEYKQSRSKLKTIAAGRLDHTLRELAEAIPGIGPVTANEVARKTIVAVDAIDMPYTQKELTVVANNLNRTLEQNKMTRRAIGYSETELWLNSVFPDTDPKKLLTWSSATFARLLEGAAKRGDNNEAFTNDVIRRFDTDTDMLVKNLHSILVVAEEHKDRHQQDTHPREGSKEDYWHQLRRHAFQRLKDDPKLAEQVYAYMEDMHTRQSQPSGKIAPGDDVPPSISSYISEVTLLTDYKPHEAQVVLCNKGVNYAASIPDRADTREQAQQAAILTFFRQYGNLRPREEFKTSKLIDLALKRAKVKRGERFETLQEICEDHFTLDIQQTNSGRERDGKSTTVTITVTSLETGEQLSLTRVGALEVAKDKVAKDILEDRRFHIMLAQCYTPLDLSQDMAKEDSAQPPMPWSQSPHVTRQSPGDSQR